MRVCTKRIIACLDIKQGKVVKGIKFQNLRIMGDPVKLAAMYEEEGADEIVFLDVSATLEGRSVLLNVLRETASVLKIPLTVGGGMKSLVDVSAALSNGADKVSLNTWAVEKNDLVEQCAKEFGSQAVVVAIDAKRIGAHWVVFTKSGKCQTTLDALQWAKKAQTLGAGEILLTSIDRDGTRLGFDLHLTKSVASCVSIPVIASGGAGRVEHFYSVLTEGKADAALAAGVFHQGSVRITQLKEYLLKKGVEVRL